VSLNLFLIKDPTDFWIFEAVCPDFRRGFFSRFVFERILASGRWGFCGSSMMFRGFSFVHFFFHHTGSSESRGCWPRAVPNRPFALPLTFSVYLPVVTSLPPTHSEFVLQVEMLSPCLTPERRGDDVFK